MSSSGVKLGRCALEEGIDRKAEVELLDVEGLEGLERRLGVGRLPLLPAASGALGLAAVLGFIRRPH